ncbi:putative membrane protein [Novosphingobium sp. PhB57]|uniref:bestrophin family protein n=1 Tax=Novosphingobium sp. PhB57 TaxID=2485107 RepID=UPI001047A738|nr:bestrophin family protein [Novosphingobium sp. PhB57]TCU57872.1 putative membrane protein [Novosphingobium sp. PhB57]
MIVRPKPGLWDVAFAIRGSILPRIVGRLVTIAAVSCLAVMAAGQRPDLFSRIGTTPFTLIGIALSIFMSFRNNACYDRWWEGRKLWGSLVIAGRSLARRVVTLEHADQRRFLIGMCGFTAGLAARLRGSGETEEIARRCGSGPWDDAVNPSDSLLRELGRHGLELARDGRVGAIHHSLIEEQLHLLAQVQAGCERIALTPVPFSYSLLLHRTAYIFCLALPFALAGSLGWWTLLPVLLVSYTFFGLDALGDQLEDPFGLEPNDLPLDAMVRTVEREMLSALGMTDLPDPVSPANYVLR